jgi:hypothetical protein
VPFGAGDVDGDVVVVRTRSAGEVESFAVGELRLFDGWKSAEKEAADVGKDGSAPRRDAALLKSQGEIPELGADIGGGFFFWKAFVEKAREVGGVVAKAILGKKGVARAEGGVCGGQRGAALATLGGAVLAACL